MDSKWLLTLATNSKSPWSNETAQWISTNRSRSSNPNSDKTLLCPHLASVIEALTCQTLNENLKCHHKSTNRGITSPIACQSSTRNHLNYVQALTLQAVTTILCQTLKIQNSALSLNSLKSCLWVRDTNVHETNRVVPQSWSALSAKAWFIKQTLSWLHLGSCSRTESRIFKKNKNASQQGAVLP